MKTHKTSVADFEYSNSVLYVKPVEGLLLDVAEMKELLKDAIELAAGDKYYAIIETSNNIDSSKDARDYYANNELNKHRFADAFIVSSLPLPLRLVINFFIRMNKAIVPTKMFNSKEAASEWIMEMQQQEEINQSTLLAN